MWYKSERHQEATSESMQSRNIVAFDIRLLIDTLAHLAHGTGFSYNSRYIYELDMEHRLLYCVFCYPFLEWNNLCLLYVITNGNQVASNRCIVRYDTDTQPYRAKQNYKAYIR